MNPVSVTGGTGSDATFNLVGGTINLTEPVSNIVVGLQYESELETMDLPVIAGGQVRRGDRITLKQAIIKVHETLALECNGYPVTFRRFDVDEFDAPLEEFSGDVKVSIRGIEDNPTLRVTVSSPLQCTILSVTTKFKVGLR